MLAWCGWTMLQMKLRAEDAAQFQKEIFACVAEIDACWQKMTSGTVGRVIK